MTKRETQLQALSNATANLSTANYPAIFVGFMAKGIVQDDITPRVNVFTYNAWLAKGRQVRRGEHGVRVTSWAASERKDENGAVVVSRRPVSTTVFHISQTDAVA